MSTPKNSYEIFCKIADDLIAIRDKSTDSDLVRKQMLEYNNIHIQHQRNNGISITGDNVLDSALKSYIDNRYSCEYRWDAAFAQLRSNKIIGYLQVYGQSNLESNMDRAILYIRDKYLNSEHNNMLKDIDSLRKQHAIEISKLHSEVDSLRNSHVADISGHTNMLKDIDSLRKQHAIEISALHSEIDSLRNSHVTEINDIDHREYQTRMEIQELRRLVNDLSHQQVNNINTIAELKRELYDAGTLVDPIDYEECALRIAPYKTELLHTQKLIIRFVRKQLTIPVVDIAINE